ncbi:MAG: hypothetical protein AAFX94_10820 [Myxococcota bacterium]
MQTGEEFLGAVSGVTAPRIPTVAGLNELLEGAERMAEKFQTEQQLQLLNNVINVYDQGAVVSAEIMKLAAAASQDIAAEQYGTSAKTAEQSAYETMRRFPDVPVDTVKYNSLIVGMFEKARGRVAKAQKSKLLITTTAPGEVYIDGRNIGPVTGRVSVDLPFGRYKVWVESASGPSIARTVTMRSGEESAVFIENALENRLQVEPRLTLTCPNEKACTQDLITLAKSAGTGLAVGVTDLDGRSMGLYVTPEGETEWQDLTQLIPAPGESGDDGEFSALYLVPFGVGQIAQDRYVAGGIYGAVQLGLLAWNIQATAARSDASDTDPDLDSLSNRQNLTAGLLYGAIAASIIESVVVWAVND